MKQLVRRNLPGMKLSTMGAVLGAAIIAAWSIGTAPAHATAYAYSSLEVSNLTILGLPSLENFQFEAQTTAEIRERATNALLSSDASSDAYLNALAPFSFADAAGCMASNNVTLNSATQDCVDPNLAFAQSGFSGTAPANNDFALLGSGLTSFVQSDAVLFDASIDADASVFSGGADWLQFAETAIEGSLSSSGEAAGDSTNKWQFGSFVVSQPTFMTVFFDVDLNYFASLTSNESFIGSDAFATAFVTLQLWFNDLTTTSPLFTDSVAVAVRNRGSGPFFSQQHLSSACGTTLASGTLLRASCRYGINLAPSTYAIAFDSSVSVKAASAVAALDNDVPEPSTLALLIVGLAAVGVMAARQCRRA